MFPVDIFQDILHILDSMNYSKHGSICSSKNRLFQINSWNFNFPFFKKKKKTPNLEYLTARSWQSYMQTQARGLNVKHKSSSRLEVMCSNRQCVQAIWLKQKGFWILFGRRPFGLGSDELKYTDWSSSYISTNLRGKFREIFLKYITLKFFTWAKWNHPFTDFVKNKKRNIYKAVKQHTRHFRNQTGSEAHPASCTMGTGSFPGLRRPGRGVDHPPQSRMPRFTKKSRAIPLLSLIGPRCL